jgi:hypothetical protein
VYPVEEPGVYREAAARCREAARSSANPREWIVMAEQWEWLADTADGSWLLPSKGNGSAPVENSASNAIASARSTPRAASSV